MKSGIYIIKNFKNGMVYIGQTKNLHTRWRTHLSSLRNNKHGNTHLQSAFNKYGEKFFRFIVLEKTDKLNQREIFWIETFGGHESSKNYNKKSGGNFGFVISIETRKSISKRQTGRKLTKQHSINIGLGNIGKKHSEETKLYMSNLYKGRKLPQWQKDKISATKKGVKLSEETKFKLKDRGNVAVLRFDLNGNYVDEFKSAKDAGEKLSFWKSDITQCCMGNRKTVKGFIFHYKNKP